MSQPANDEFSQHLSDDEASNHEDASDTGAAPKQQQQVIQNGNSKKRISTGKDGVIRILPPVTAAEIQAVEKERKAKNILLMAIPKEHMRRFHGMDDAKEIWEAIRTRFGGNANSKKMQKATHGAEVSTKDANHKFLSCTITLGFLSRKSVLLKTFSCAQNVAFVSQSKSSTNKVKSSFTGAYSTCTPSTSSTNIPEKEALVGFADEIAMIAIQMKRFYKKIGRRVRVDGKAPVGFDKKKLECFFCSQYWVTSLGNVQQKGTHDGNEEENISEVKRPNHALMSISSSSEVTKDHRKDFEVFNGRSVTFSHKVLFTKTDCLVVSSDFKMPDENQILLKVLRHHNMYSFNMKTLTPAKSFACLIAKATSDESKIWHKRLGVCIRQTPNDTDFEEKDEDAELIVVPSDYKEASSTSTSEDNPKILDFRRELEAIAQKHLGTVPENNSTSNLSVNSGSEPVNTGKLDPDDSPMPELENCHKSETGIFDEASYDEEGVVTDFNSLPTEIKVSPTPTLRIHNIHPKSQILGDPKSAVQTRSKVQQKLRAHALIGYIQKQQRNNHKDQQHCLFACFLSQEEPKKISEALQDDSWVQVMPEELLQFKLQQIWVLVDLPYGMMVTQEEGIDYDEVFALWQEWKLSDEEVYVSQPPGFVDPDHPKKVYKVVKALYGLHQAPRAWSLPRLYISIVVKENLYVLKGRPKFGLWFTRESPFDLEAFSDSDYGGSNLDRKSTIGGCQFLRQRLISWQCKKQTIVATSTTEAEYVAAIARGQVLWVQNQLLDYGFNFMNTKIHIDNESTICIVKNPVYHSNDKAHRDRHHFLRVCYEKKHHYVGEIQTELM
ncbi:putative ribonuclease H-like domain-containing protein [Tanacetum coccineum]